MVIHEQVRLLHRHYDIMAMRHFVIIVFLLLDINCFGLHFPEGNNILPHNILSPHAASLGQYGKIPVSMFYGHPVIEIPFFTVKTGSHEIPVKLSYKSGGIRPDEHPGPAGCGWSLLAGGSISRQIVDAPDEMLLEEVRGLKNRTTDTIGYYYRHNERKFDTRDQALLRTELTKAIEKGYWDMDCRADIFNVNSI